jgi:hypothetical protein
MEDGHTGLDSHLPNHYDITGVPGRLLCTDNTFTVANSRYYDNSSAADGIYSAAVVPKSSSKLAARLIHSQL